MKKSAIRSLFFLGCLISGGLLTTISRAEPEIRKALSLTESATTSPAGATRDIRIAPMISSDPATMREAQFAVADGFYQRKEYELASAEFQKFLQMSVPGDLHRDQALFHLGEAYRLLGKGMEAQTSYQELLRENPSGDMTASASYRMGEYYHAKKELQKAIEAFSQAAQLSKSITIQNTARYQQGLCHDELGDPEKATHLFDEIAKTTEDKTTRATALMLSANEHQKLGHFEQALNTYLAISSENSSNLGAEALVKAGMISTQLKDNKQALKFFEKAADLARILHTDRDEEAAKSDEASQVAATDAKKRTSGVEQRSVLQADDGADIGAIQTDTTTSDSENKNCKGGSSWSAIAALGVMKIAYEEKDYKKVLMRSPQALTSSNVEACSQALFLTSQAERQLGHLQKALELDDRILKEFPESASAHNAAFVRLLLLQSLKDPSLLTQINELILTTTDPHQKAQAMLLQAETLFQQKNYASAVKSYRVVKESDLSPTLKADAAYKEAWSLQHLGDDTSALNAYTTFLTTYPKSPAAPNALIQCAYLEQKRGDLNAAWSDYSQFLEKYPHAPEGELVLQQKALVERSQQNNHAMVLTFQQLLTTYPNSNAAAEANYWIGWNSFEEKDYQKAIPFFEKTKQLDAKKWREKAGVRLLLCHYYLQQPELAVLDATGLPASTIPGEVARWIGLKAYERGDLDQTEEFLSLVVVRNDPNLTTRDVAMALAETFMKKEKYAAAKVPAAKALELATDPATRAAAILVLAKIEQGLGNYHQADNLTREALLLQPEGRFNMEGRLLMGDLLLAQHHEEEAARAYMAIALLTDDSTITPSALRKAAEAYRRAHRELESQKALQELQQRFP